MGTVIELEACDRCQGTGKVNHKQMYDAQVYGMPAVCPKCKGRRIQRVNKPKRVWGYTIKRKK